jgi:uncharacterized repeat protein (TIGR01451 family)
MSRMRKLGNFKTHSIVSLLMYIRAKSKITMYKLLVASISAIGLIATTTLTSQLPAPAQLQTTPATTAPTAAKRVVLTYKAEKKVMETVDKKQKVTYQATGKSVKPGDILRYTVTAKNSDRPVKNLTLTQPIPKGTRYIKNSATPLADAELLFSIDGGKTYSSKPTIDKKEAPAAAYTNVRWKFASKSTPANAQINAACEVEVK